MIAPLDLTIRVDGIDYGPGFYCAECGVFLLDNNGNGNAPVYVSLATLAQIVTDHVAEAHQ